MYLAEYLPRLDQISVIADIPDGPCKLKSLSILKNTLFLSLQRSKSESTDDPSSPVDETALEIPLPISDSSRLKEAKINKLSASQGTLSIGISLGKTDFALPSTPFTQLPEASSIWSVSDLLRKTPRNKEDINQFKFVCADCNREIVDSGSYKFVDMPSEFWHEMMDFWHCHKPHEDHHNINDKNYNGLLLPRPGFVNVGSTYIVIQSDSDRCASCGTILGTMEQSALKINKWKLRLQYSGTYETYSPFAFVYFAILDRINSAGSRKFSLKLKNSMSAYTIWVSSVGLEVCYDNQTLSQCLKMLYYTSDVMEEDVLELPKEVWDSLRSYFTENTVRLPEASRSLRIMEGDCSRTYNVCYLSQNPGQ